MEEEELGSKNFDLKLTARLLGHLRPYGTWVGLTFALIFMASAIQQAGPYLTKVAVDEYILPGNAEGLGGVISLFVGLLVLQFALGYAQSWLTSMVGQWAMRDVRVALFSRLQHLPLGFFDRTPVGRLMARGRSDDNEDTIRNRLSVFAEQTAPLAEYYRKQGLLKEVYGMGEVDEIFARIEAALKDV